MSVVQPPGAGAGVSPVGPSYIPKSSGFFSGDPLTMSSSSAITPEGLEKNIVASNENSHPTSFLGKITHFFKENPEAMRALKILTVGLVVTGLILATVFTFGAAIPAVAAVGATASAASSAGACALLGTAIGLGISVGSVIKLAYAMKMHKIGEHGFEDIGAFVTNSIFLSGLHASLFATFGAGIGGGAGAFIGTVGLIGQATPFLYITWFERNFEEWLVPKRS